LGGHGIGAKLALATGCYNPERVTGICIILGVFNLDGGPLDHRYYESF
jgi:hypothetical protein